jgi:hypothetical protein
MSAEAAATVERTELERLVVEPSFWNDYVAIRTAFVLAGGAENSVYAMRLVFDEWIRHASVEDIQLRSGALVSWLGHCVYGAAIDTYVRFRSVGERGAA